MKSSTDYISYYHQCVFKEYEQTLILLIYLNFQPVKVVPRYSDLQPQVVENYSNLFNLGQNIYKS